MRNKIIATIAATLAVGGTVAGATAAQADHPNACFAYVQLWEDGSWSPGPIFAPSGDLIRDRFAIVPAHLQGGLVYDQHGQVAFGTDYPVSVHGQQCNVFVEGAW